MPVVQILGSRPEGPHFIKFQVVVGLRHHQGLLQVRQLPPFSLSQSLKVLRLTLNTRAMPRMEARS